MSNNLNVNKLTKTLSEILSKKYGCMVTITATPKNSKRKNKKEEGQCT